MRAIRPLLLLSLVLSACGDSTDQACQVDTSYDPVIDPARFVSGVDNPLFPLTPGARQVYTSGDERVEVVVTSERKTILGVSAVVVHDTATVNGELTEDTFDWYAQDVDGNVWYMGEDTKELEGGQVTSTEGSWEAGVNGAKPGILIPGTPMVGVPYRQEYAPCEAEDLGQVLATAQTVTVPTGTYTGCLETLDTSALEPGVQEQKFYCPGIGLALTVDLQTTEREELVEKSP